MAKRAAVVLPWEMPLRITFCWGSADGYLETARLPAVTHTAEDCVVTSTSAVTGVAADKLCGATHSWQASGQRNQ